MNKLMLLALIASSLTGCAAFDAGRYDGRVDTNKIAMVDRQARMNNIEVHWVNLPVRKPDPVTAVPATGPQP
jgi:hypothetical protein